jgi:tetratricopeptide (TPR) repeat protein
MNRAPDIILLAFFALFSVVPAALAATAPTPQKIEFASLSEAQRLHALIQLATSGRHEDAAKLLSAYPLTGPLAPNRTLFVEGLILRARGNLKHAATSFRRALASDPSLTMVRAELAQTLYALGEDDSAKHHLELLMSEAPDQDSANSIKSFIDQIDSRRPYRFNAYVSLAPTTNMTGGTTTRKIYYSDGQGEPVVRAKSGTGLTAGVNAAYTHDFGNKYVGVLGAGINGRFYQDEAFNEATASETTEIRRLIERGYVGLGAVASQTTSGDKTGFASLTAGPRASVFYQFTPKTSVQSATTIEFKRYNESPEYDGYTLSENLTFTYAFNQDFTGFLFGGLDRNKTDDSSHNDYFSKNDSWSPMIGLGIYKELPLGLTVNSDARLRYTQTDGEWEQTNSVREDERFDGTASLTKRDWNFWGYAPVLEYSYTKNWSNIGQYISDAHTVDFRLTKDF